MTESQKHREFVESKWDITSEGWGRFAASIWASGPSIKEFYETANQLTLERLEAIRQIEEEIREFWVSDEDDWRRIIFDELEEGWLIATRVIRQCRLCRSRTRLEALRDEMKRGMRV